MKSILSAVLFCISINTYANIVNDSAFLHQLILNGVQNSTYIFEGEVINKESYFNSNGDFIYTSNTIKINQVWKNNEAVVIEDSQLVEVITRGGIVGSTQLLISHQKVFTIGEKGMFLCKPTSRPINPSTNILLQYNFDLYDELYFEYDYSKPYLTASYASVNFECIERLYEIIDPNFVADCINVNANGTLQKLRYLDVQAVGAQKLVSATSGSANYTLTFENGHTVSGPQGSFFEFDIFISTQSSSPVYCDFNTISIQYNELAFGDTIVGSNKITVQRGQVCSDYSQYLNPQVSDFNGYWAHQFNIVVVAVGTPTNRFKLGSVPKQLVHVSIEVEDCTKLPELEFANTGLMVAQSSYTVISGLNPNGTSTAVYFYNQLTAWDTENPIMCATNISNIHPMVLNAGVGDTIWVEGENFGNIGKLTFAETDVGGINWGAKLDSADIISWSDSLIVAIVPGMVAEDSWGAETHIPATGYIRVSAENVYNTVSNQDIYPQKVKVGYAIHSIKTFDIFNPPFSRPKTTVYLGGVDSVLNEDGFTNELGFSFTYNTAIAQDTGALNCIKQAVDEWVCATSTRFSIDTVSSWPSVLNGHNTISFLSGTLPLQKRGETQQWGLYCGNFPNDTFSVQEIDIVVNSDLVSSGVESFLFDRSRTQNLGSWQYDFFAIILHELGHAVSLEHVLNDYDMMQPTTQHSYLGDLAQYRQVYFTTANMDGGSYVVDKSSVVGFVDCQPGAYFAMQPLVQTSCTPLPWVTSVENKNLGNSSISYYPNPFNANLTLKIDARQSSLIQLQLFTVTGSLLHQSHHQISVGENIIPLEIYRNFKGVIFAVLTVNGITRNTVLIKQ